MAREITYSWHSEVGHGRTNFKAERIGDYLNFLGRYWDISFRPVNGGGRIKFILSNLKSSWAAATRGFECRISSSKNWADAGEIYRDMICAKVCCHEFGHMVLQGNIHTGTPGLMDTSASMPTGNLVPSDYRWFDAYPRKPGSKRPHEEPNAMRRAFIPGFQSVSAQSDQAFELDSTLTFGCDHEPVKRPWYDFRPQSWVRP